MEETKEKVVEVKETKVGMEGLNKGMEDEIKRLQQLVKDLMGREQDLKNELIELEGLQEQLLRYEGKKIQGPRGGAAAHFSWCNHILIGACSCPHSHWCM